MRVIFDGVYDVTDDVDLEWQVGEGADVDEAWAAVTRQYPGHDLTYRQATTGRRVAREEEQR